MTHEKPFLDAEMSLPRLAEILKLPRNRLSQLLNEFIKRSFFDFINEYRVEEAKRLLRLSPVADTILDIAFDAGFNSKATFNAAFKKSTGMTPSQFRSSRADSRKQRLIG
mgnify:CR=1 FL=1